MQELSYENISGEFLNRSAGGSVLRLTLDADALVILEMWLDLGGSWMTLQEGRYQFSGSTLITTLRDFEWCWSAFPLDGKLHVRSLQCDQATPGSKPQQEFVLAPSDAIEELDQLVQDNPLWFASSSGWCLGTRMFFKDS